MKRREFLQGLFGAAAFGATARPEASPATADRVPTPEPEMVTPQQAMAIEMRERSEPTTEAAEQHEPTMHTPRTSPQLEAVIAERMSDLRTSFGAEIIFNRAHDMQHEGEPLMEVVRTTFHEQLLELPRFQDMDPKSIEWMVDICCRGEVTAESAWDVHAVGSGTDRGLWQITDIASDQIAIERRTDTTAVDRFDPIDATRGAAEYFDFVLRALHDWIDKEPGDGPANSGDSEELNIFDLVNETEFVIPLIITGYKCGPGPLRTALSNFYRSEPDTSKVGLDVFFNFITYVREHPVSGISDSTLDYFLKCLSLQRIFEDIHREGVASE